MTGFVTRFLVSVIKCFVFQLDFQLKAAFAVVPTDNIYGWSLSLNISLHYDVIHNAMENESEAKSIQVLKNQTISNFTECQVTA